MRQTIGASAEEGYLLDIVPDAAIDKGRGLREIGFEIVDIATPLRELCKRGEQPFLLRVRSMFQD